MGASIWNRIQGSRDRGSTSEMTRPHQGKLTLITELAGGWLEIDSLKVRYPLPGVLLASWGIRKLLALYVWTDLSHNVR